MATTSPVTSSSPAATTSPTTNTTSVTSSSPNSNSISSQIDSLVAAYTQQLTDQKVTPLKNDEQRYQDISNGYDVLTKNLTDLQTSVNTLQQTGTSSVFEDKTTTSSDSKFVTATATSAASSSGYDIRVSQLAKSDVVVSQDQTLSAANAITGTHTFDIYAGGGTAGQLVSHVSVTFGASETNQTAMQKIASAINSNSAVVTSNAETDTAAPVGGAATSFTVNLNGTKTTIPVTDVSSYGAMLNNIGPQISQLVPGLTVQKLSNTPSAGQDQLQIKVNNATNYVTITPPTSGYDPVTDLGIGVRNLVGASGIVTGSEFTPTSTTTQLSITANKTGLDYRIENLADTGTGTALASVGLNLGATRPTFSQAVEPNTPGFIYPDTTTANNLLNAKFTFNSLSIQRNSNNVSDLASGVTFNLNATQQSTDPDTTITVQPDVGAITSAIQDYITKFNAVYTNIKQNSVSSLSEQGIFVGDSNAQTLFQTLSAQSVGKIPGIPNGNLSYLTLLGITFDPTTGLSVTDNNQLKSQITTVPDQVGAIFNSSSGIATTLYKDVTPYLGVGGYLAKTKKIFGDNIQNLSDRITKAQTQISVQADTLRNEYVQLQVEMSQLSNTYSLFGVGGTSSSLFG